MLSATDNKPRSSVSHRMFSSTTKPPSATPSSSSVDHEESHQDDLILEDEPISFPELTTDAFEIQPPLDSTMPAGRLLVTCEHATNRLPAPYQWAREDEAIANMHWAVDHGAAEFTRELAAVTNSPALLARFSRLLVDCNRPLTSETLFRSVADSRPVALNTDLADFDRGERLRRFYEPYHRALRMLANVGGGSAAALKQRSASVKATEAEAVAAHEAEVAALAAAVAATPAGELPPVPPLKAVELVVSVHSFTPVYEGTPRKVEIGVLFSKDNTGSADLARALTAALVEDGFDARLNEPWSGLEGFMFAADSVTADPVRRAIMIELRQDLALNESWRHSVLSSMLGVLGDEGFL